MSIYEIPSGNTAELIKKAEPKNKEIEKENSDIYIHTAEEVRLLFEEIIGETKYEEVRKLYDEKGLYLWEIKVAEENGSVGYEYIRKGNYREKRLAGGAPLETSVHITWFDNDGLPISGTSVANFFNGKWEYCKDAR